MIPRKVTSSCAAHYLTHKRLTTQVVFLFELIQPTRFKRGDIWFHEEEGLHVMLVYVLTSGFKHPVGSKWPTLVPKAVRGRYKLYRLEGFTSHHNQLILNFLIHFYVRYQQDPVVGLSSKFNDPFQNRLG